MKTHSIHGPSLIFFILIQKLNGPSSYTLELSVHENLRNLTHKIVFCQYKLGAFRLEEFSHLTWHLW